MHAVAIRGLVKTFGSFRALDGLDLTVGTGEVHGFLGPNGSGKTTTIRVLLGLLRADAGEVTLLDGDPWTENVELHRRLAYVPGDVSLWPKLSGGEIIDLFGRTVQAGTLDELRRLTRTAITAETRRPVAGLASLPGVHGVESDGTVVHFDVDGDHLELAMTAVAGAGILRLTSSPPTLEELFLRHYGDELDGP